MDNSHQPPAEEQLEFLDYWRLLKAQWVIVASVLVAGILIAACLTRLQPQVYVATTRIKVEGDRTTTAVFDIPKWSDGNFMQNQTEIIQSQKILYPVIEKLGLREKWAQRNATMTLQGALVQKIIRPVLWKLHLTKNDPRQPRVLSVEEAFGKLKMQLDVRRSGNSSLLAIVVSDTDPKRSALIANTIASVFEEQRLEGRRQQMQSGIEKLRAELMEQQNRVRLAQEKVEKLRKELNVPLFGASRYSDVELQQLERDLVQARLQAVTQDVRLKELQKLSPEQRRSAIATLINEPNLQKLLQDLTDAEFRLSVLRQGYGVEHPTVQETTAARDKLQQQLDQRLDGVLQSFQVDLKMAQTKAAELQVQYEEKKKASTAMEDASYLPFRNAQREEESERSLFEVIRSRLQQEAFEVEASRSPVELIDRATVPDDPIRPIVMKNYAFGCAGGLALGVILVFLLEFASAKIKRLEDVEKHLHLPVLAVIPNRVGNLARGNGTIQHAEVYRMLRANIDFAKKDKSVNSFCLLSAGAGEGKSLTTANLACVWAGQGMQVLVVDCDLHRPSIHNHLQVPNESGLSDYLTSAKSVEQVIKPTEVPNLSVIPSGRSSNHNGSLPALTSERMRDLIQQVGKQFDVVLYDTPPVLSISDALIVAREVGSSILVVQHRRYSRKMEQRAIKLIGSTGATLLGAVMNKIGSNHAELESYYYSAYEKYRGAAEHQKAAK